jgi:hypothetical protein
MLSQSSDSGQEIPETPFILVPANLSAGQLESLHRATQLFTSYVAMVTSGRYLAAAAPRRLLVQMGYEVRLIQPKGGDVE